MGEDGEVAVPLREAVNVEMLVVTVKVPEDVPTFVGANVTLMLVLAPGVRVRGS